MDKRFILSPEERHPIAVLDDISLVRLPLGEHVALKSIKKRVRVAAGALLAMHSSPNEGDMHSPFNGVIKDLTATFIEIAREDPPRTDAATGESAAPVAATAAKGADDAMPDPAAPVEPVSLDGLEPMALAETLKRLGRSARPFTRPCDVFIINCLNPEPGMLYAEELLAGYKPVIEAGFALLRRLNNAPQFILALPQGSSFTMEGAESRHLRPVYPISLARPMIRAITGKEDTSRVTLVRLHALFQLGLVAESGLPLTHSVTTAFGANYLAPLGTPVATLLELSGQAFTPGDALILGGAMRGVAISGTRRGIRKNDDAVVLVKKGGRPPLEDNPCINCGACVSFCPMRLRPNMLSRYAEFEQYEACRAEYIEVCIECGMCGYICPMCRPMQQLFRMAKANLGMRTLQHLLRQ